jgi:hypothetical protein
MKVGPRFIAAAVGAILGLWDIPANATTILFNDSSEPVQVFIDGTKAVVGGDPGLLDPITSEAVRTTVFDTFCLFCTTGIRGVVLFEPGTSEVSDFVIALPLFGGFPFEIFTQFFFESDPDILFYANHSPFVAMEAALLNSLTTKALSGQIPKIDETGITEPGKEQVLFDSGQGINLFRDLNGATADLDSSFVIKVISDVSDVPEPSAFWPLFLLIGFAVIRGIKLTARRPAGRPTTS